MLDFLIDFALIIFLIGELVVLITALAFLASLFPRTARNAVLYIVSLVAYHYIPSYCLDFIGLCRDSSVPTVFFLTTQSIYFINHSSAYSIKSVLAYLIRLAKKVIYGTLKGLSQAMFYSCVFINLGFALLLFSTFNDY